MTALVWWFAAAQALLLAAAVWALRLRARLAAAYRRIHTDHLTGARSRAWLEDSSADHRWRGLVLVDLDHFSAINEVYGHRAGDLALIAAVERLHAAGGVLARLGGDEFAIVVEDPRLVAQVAHRAGFVVADGELVSLPGGARVGITASVGYTEAAPGEDLEALLARADLALCHHKRGCCCPQHDVMATAAGWYPGMPEPRPAGSRRYRDAQHQGVCP